MHRGSYAQRHLSFGLKVALSLFQQIMDAMLAGLDYVMAYLDEILIKSENMEQHRKHIWEILKRINNYSFKLVPEKCEFFMERMKYLGQIIDQKSKKPDPERAKAIKNMPSPDNVTKLQAFLGLASYYSIYILKIYELRAPLNELLKKCEKWCWSVKRHFKKYKNVYYQILL